MSKLDQYYDKQYQALDLVKRVKRMTLELDSLKRTLKATYGIDPAQIFADAKKSSHETRRTQ